MFSVLLSDEVFVWRFLRGGRFVGLEFFIRKFRGVFVVCGFVFVGVRKDFFIIWKMRWVMFFCYI